MNQELFNMHLCNQGSHYDPNIQTISRSQRKPSRTTTKLMLSKDEWNAKEDTGKSLKNALHILRYAKTHLSMLNSEKIKPVALAVIELC